MGNWLLMSEILLAPASAINAAVQRKFVKEKFIYKYKNRRSIKTAWDSIESGLQTGKGT